jgi:hypothetical protein
MAATPLRLISRCFGGLRIDVRDDRIVVVTPRGDVLVHDSDLVEATERRAAELEARLRAAGIEP